MTCLRWRPVPLATALAVAAWIPLAAGGATLAITNARAFTGDSAQAVDRATIVVEDGRIVAIYVVRNPDKLKHMAETVH